MNKVILVGRLARDPELRTTGGGQSVCRFAVAVDRRFKREGQPTADFINVVAFAKQAETINQYLGKGRRIALEGRIQTGSYTAQDGSKRYTTDVVLESFDFVESSNGNQGQNQGQGQYQGQGYQQNQPQQNQGYQNQGQYQGQSQGYQNRQGQGYQNQGQQQAQNYQNQTQQNNIDMDSDFHLMADDDELPF